MNSIAARPLAGAVTEDGAPAFVAHHDSVLGDLLQNCLALDAVALDILASP